MANGDIPCSFGRIEWRLVVVPIVGRFAEPESGNPGAHLAILDDVFEPTQLMKCLTHGLEHFRGTAMILRIRCLHWPELEEVDDLCAVPDISIKLSSPTGRRISRPMRHYIKVNLRFRVSLDARPEQVERNKIHLLRTHRHLENVILTPRHRHTAIPEEGYPFVCVAQVEVLVMWGVVRANQCVGQPLSQYCG